MLLYLIHCFILKMLFIKAAIATEDDPCSPDVYKKLPHLESRYKNYITTTTLVQDSVLLTDWYHTGDVTMLNFHPDDLFECGTKFPIWLKDPHPRKENQETEATVCYMKPGGYFCVDEFPIRIINCPGRYFVYRLVPTAPDSAYCFGVGKSGNPPTYTANKPSVTQGLQTLVDETSRKSYTYTEAYFLCHFLPSTTESLLYRAIWYQNGIPLYTSSYGTTAEDIALLLTEPLFVEYGFKLGNEISCEVQAFYEEMGRPGSRSERSESFFAGIKVLTPTMNFAFGEEDASKRTIRLQPTVSVGCYATDTCHIDLLASIPEGANNKQCNSLVLEGRRCGAQIHSENVAKTEVEIVVTPADSGQYLDREVYNEVHLRVPETLENKIWDNYALQPIGIHMTSSGTKRRDGSRCDANTDPHMRTFDHKRYGLQHYLNHIAGVYILYRNEKFNTTVQLQVDRCSPGRRAYCNYGVAAQAGQDVFIISYREKNLQINYTSCGDGSLKVKSYTELKYEIYFPYGTYVQVNIRFRGGIASVHIQPSVYDDGKTLGLCGTLDGDTSNDFTDKSANIVRRDQFLESWRIKTAEENLFDRKFDLTSLTPMQMDVCICEKDTTNYLPLRNEVSCKKNAVASCRKGKDTSKVLCPSFGGRKRRSVDRNPKTPTVTFPYRTIRDKRETLTWTREDAENFCTKYMMENPIYSLCEQIPNARPEEAIEDCIEDIMLTDGTDWAKVSLETMRSTCTSELARNVSLWTAEYNTLSIAETIESNFCTNNCSENGSCIDGVCDCHYPYVGSDCSLDKRVPPEMHGLLDDGLCDEREMPCTDAHFFAYPLIDSPNLTCHLTEFFISITGIRKHNAEHLVAAEFTTIAEAVCPLEGIRIKRETDNNFVYGYTVQVSYDGTYVSNGTDLYIFDSTCQNVEERDGEMTFSILDGFCFIEGECVAHKQSSILDNCSMCDTTLSLESWSPSIYNEGCGFTTTTQTTTNATTSADLITTNSFTNTHSPTVTTGSEETTHSSTTTTSVAKSTITATSEPFTNSQTSITPSSTVTQNPDSTEKSEQKFWIIGVIAPCIVVTAIAVGIVIYLKSSKPRIDAISNLNLNEITDLPRRNTSSSLTPVAVRNFGHWPKVFGEYNFETKPPTSTDLFRNLKRN